MDAVRVHLITSKLHESLVSEFAMGLGFSVTCQDGVDLRQQPVDEERFLFIRRTRFRKDERQS